MKKNIKNGINFILKVFWIFVIGSVFGFIIEMLYATIYTRTLVIRQGLIYGPFILYKYMVWVQLHIIF